MISLSIDVTLLDKTRIKEVTRRNGKVAKFVNLILIETPGSEYGDYIVKESMSKEEKSAVKELPILGNGKNIGGGRRQPAPESSEPSEPATGAPPDDDVPF
jgi:hypothetical protein